MNGSIQNQNITNVEIPLDEVEGTQMFSFPDREISGSSSGVLVVTVMEVIKPLKR